VNTQPLNAVRIAVVATFALACFGLMLYLWNAFGGAVPLKPKGYRVTVALPEADLLATQADVRISGVSVGKVIRTAPRSATDRNRKDAVLEIDPRYAPLPRDVRATIRRKSIAGEEYLELTPGTRTASAVPDGGRIADANVAPSVEIDEVLRTFDAPTRRNFEQWIQGQAASIEGRGGDLNAAFGNLPGFEEQLAQILQTLNRQQAAVRAAVSNTGEVFDALSASRDALRGAIVNGKRATDAFAQQDKAFADVWRALPPFEANSRRLLDRAERFRKNADPVLTQLRPGFRELGRTLQETKPTAKELNGLMHGVGPLSDAGTRGLPAARQFFKDFRPFLAEWVPFLEQFNPLLAYVGANSDAITTLVANATAITQQTAAGYGTSAPLHVARSGLMLGPDALALYPDHALPTNRANPYPSGADRLTATTPYKVFDDRGCGPLRWPRLADAIPGTGISQDLIEKIRHFALNDDQPAAPPCLLQEPAAGGTAYPHVAAQSHTPGGGGTP
jgi:virulence factor Mce-like protein